MLDHSIICALSTPSGPGAIAVIRLSGEGCVELADRIFVAASGNSLLNAKANSVIFGKVMDEGHLLDEVLVTLFHAPHSYTGEDTVEISCHGSLYIRQRILQLLVKEGARMALPGEFTQRAFLNGKMDLSQAEAVADLIASSSAASHRMSINQMKGGFSKELNLLRDELLQIISLLELELDFSEEEVEFADRSQLMELGHHILKLLRRLANSFSVGNAIKHGIPVTIAGNTNVGKSTLLNALLNEDKAIVSDIAGTTRDVIEDTINLNGITFRFIDTAGIRQTSDEVENLGIGRTFEKIGQATIVLLMTDLLRGVESFGEYYRQVKEKIDEKAHLIILLNKQDCVEDVLTTLEDIRLITEGEEIIPISAKTGYNISFLIERLTALVHLHTPEDSDVIVSNARHYEALLHAADAIERAMNGIETGISNEFVAQDVRECIHFISEITGQISNDEILGNIFKNFCIGK